MLPFPLFSYLRWLLCPCLLLLAWLYGARAAGQTTEIVSPLVRTVLVKSDGTGGLLPVLRLGTRDRLTVHFDHMSHDYPRYVFSLVHLDAKFRPEPALFAADYASEGGDPEVIEEGEISLNTTVAYTHFAFTVPGEHLRPLLSGNYRLTVSEETEEGTLRPAFHAYFYVVESGCSITAQASTDTDIDRGAKHQQLTLEVNHAVLAPRLPSEELEVVVVQNGNPHLAARPTRPTGTTLTSLRYEHCRELIFAAGNEYRKFELPSTRYPGLHVERVRYATPYYHAVLQADEPRANYLYDEDANGRFVPLADRGGDAHTEGDYLMTHFLLETDAPIDAPLYVSGAWSGYSTAAPYQLHYNAEAGGYEAALLLKQGYYSYRYAPTIERYDRAAVNPAEGDWAQAENEYDILVYYRPAGARYTRLVGWRRASFRPH